jgi:AcrR family transcriptional regulator
MTSLSLQVSRRRSTLGSASSLAPRVGGDIVDRDAAILDVAAAHFAQHGYRQTDVQNIADALGLGKGTIYRRFATKEDLFLASADRGMRKLTQTVDAAAAAQSDALEQISAAVHAYLQFFADHPQYVELIIQERAEFRHRETPTYFAYRQASIERWKPVYRALIDQGQMRDVPVERIIEVISGLVYGTMFINFFTGRIKSPASQARDILDVVFRGILLPSSSAPAGTANRSTKATRRPTKSRNRPSVTAKLASNSRRKAS